MRCLKLACYENVSPLKVVYRNFVAEENSCVGGYRWGFNGQERDDEVYGTGNLNKTLFCQYDTWLERKWNVDPVDQISFSNYACFVDNPIINIDLLGDKMKNGHQVTADCFKNEMDRTMTDINSHKKSIMALQMG